MAAMSRRRPQQTLLLGEWACLGILYAAPNHGFAIAARLKPGGDIGRVWSMSRALTYRSLEQLAQRQLIHPIREEPGIAGGNRTILAATRTGRAHLRRWLATPVQHLRDIRSELLLKLVLADRCNIDITEMLHQQHQIIEQRGHLHHGDGPTDVVQLWRTESSNAALRFLEQIDKPTDNTLCEPSKR